MSLKLYLHPLSSYCWKALIALYEHQTAFEPVIVDLAAERGGNCELTRPGETVVYRGVTVMGPLNLPSTLAHHASQLFAKNISTFLLHLVKNGQLHLDTEDEIVCETLLTSEGKVVHPNLRGVME